MGGSCLPLGAVFKPSPQVRHLPKQCILLLYQSNGTILYGNGEIKILLTLAIGRLVIHLLSQQRIARQHIGLGVFGDPGHIELLALAHVHQKGLVKGIKLDLGGLVAALLIMSKILPFFDQPALDTTQQRHERWW